MILRIYTDQGVCYWPLQMTPFQSIILNEW